jgi:hypothetical protein
MKKCSWIIGVVIIGSTTCFAQTKTITTAQQIWTGYFNQSRFSNKWGTWLDLQLRTKEAFFTNFSQSILRGGITYYVNDLTKLTIGDAYISHYPADNHKKVTQPEHRPWQQLQWHTNYAKIKTTQRLRLEERFRRKVLNESKLADGSNFNFRVCYNFLVQVPLIRNKVKGGDFSFIFNDEIQINFGKQIVHNTFDQNRAFIGFAFHVNAHDNLQFGYMNVFQQLGSEAAYRMLHVGRLNYFHTIDWRKAVKL